MEYICLFVYSETLYFTVEDGRIYKMYVYINKAADFILEKNLIFAKKNFRDKNDSMMMLCSNTRVLLFRVNVHSKHSSLSIL